MRGGESLKLPARRANTEELALVGGQDGPEDDAGENRRQEKRKSVRLAARLDEPHRHATSCKKAETGAAGPRVGLFRHVKIVACAGAPVAKADASSAPWRENDDMRGVHLRRVELVPLRNGEAEPRLEELRRLSLPEVDLDARVAPLREHRVRAGAGRSLEREGSQDPAVVE